MDDLEVEHKEIKMMCCGLLSFSLEWDEWRAFENK